MSTSISAGIYRQLSCFNTFWLYPCFTTFSFDQLLLVHDKLYGESTINQTLSKIDLYAIYHVMLFQTGSLVSAAHI